MMAPTPAITIDRLVFDMPGIDAGSGARLADMVASHLAGSSLAASDVAIPSMSIVLDSPDTDLDRLARRIAGAVLRQVG